MQPPAFGALALRVTLLIAAYYAAAETMHGCGGERLHHLSVLGLLVPELCGLPKPAFAALQLAFLACAGAWALRRFVPWSSWAAAALFLVIESARQETSYLSDHEAYTLTMALVLFAAWFHFDRERIRAGDLAMPPWLPRLAAAYLAWTYTLSGLGKLLASGPAWADGSALRLWVVQSGGADSALGAAIAASPALARIAMTGTLLVETLAVAAVPFRIPSIALGVTLIAMHVGSSMLFGVGFYGNIALCALFLVWFPSAVDHRQPGA